MSSSAQTATVINSYALLLARLGSFADDVDRALSDVSKKHLDGFLQRYASLSVPALQGKLNNGRHALEYYLSDVVHIEQTDIDIFTVALIESRILNETTVTITSTSSSAIVDSAREAAFDQLLHPGRSISLYANLWEHISTHFPHHAQSCFIPLCPMGAGLDLTSRQAHLTSESRERDLQDYFVSHIIPSVAAAAAANGLYIIDTHVNPYLGGLMPDISIHSMLFRLNRYTVHSVCELKCSTKRGFTDADKGQVVKYGYNILFYQHIPFVMLALTDLFHVMFFRFTVKHADTRYRADNQQLRFSDIEVEYTQDYLLSATNRDNEGNQYFYSFLTGANSSVKSTGIPNIHCSDFIASTYKSEIYGRDGCKDQVIKLFCGRETSDAEAQIYKVIASLPANIQITRLVNDYVSDKALVLRPRCLNNITSSTLRSERSDLSPSTFHAVVNALEALHGLGILHMDTRMDNILYSSDGRLYLTDFGHARTGPEVTADLCGASAIYWPAAFLVAGIDVLSLRYLACHDLEILVRSFYLRFYASRDEKAAFMKLYNELYNRSLRPSVQSGTEQPVDQIYLAILQLWSAVVDRVDWQPMFAAAERCDYEALKKEFSGLINFDSSRTPFISSFNRGERTSPVPAMDLGLAANDPQNIEGGERIAKKARTEAVSETLASSTVSTFLTELYKLEWVTLGRLGKYRIKRCEPSETFLHQHGLKRENVEGRGNCTFLAIVDQLKYVLGTEIDVASLRGFFYQYAITRVGELAPFGITRADIEDMKHDGAWANNAGDAAALFIAIELNLNIRVFNGEFYHEFHYGENSPYLNLYLNGNHYQSTRRLANYYSKWTSNH